MADSILGDDPCKPHGFLALCVELTGSIAQATQNKYALVCEKCFRHNGLVGGKYEWERMREYSARRYEYIFVDNAAS